jgi:hypothetical protein
MTVARVILPVCIAGLIAAAIWVISSFTGREASPEKAHDKVRLSRREKRVLKRMAEEDARADRSQCDRRGAW